MSRITSKAVFSDPKVLALCNCARGERPVVLIPALNSTNNLHQAEKTQDETDETVSSASSSINSDVLIHNSGWFFHSFHRHILSEDEIKILCQRIRRQLSEIYPSLKSKLETDEANDSIDVNGRSLSLPPMLFGSDLLLIQGPPGSIQIDPIDALICWISQVITCFFFPFSMNHFLISFSLL